MAEIVLLGEVQDLAGLPMGKKPRGLIVRPRPLVELSKPEAKDRPLIVRPRPLVEFKERPRPARGLLWARRPIRAALNVQDEGLGAVKKKKKAKASALPQLPALMQPMAPPPGPTDAQLSLGAQLAAEAAQGMRYTPMPIPGGLPESLQEAGVLDRVTGGIQQGASWVERLGGQVVNVLNAGTQLKQATAMQKWQVGQAWNQFQGQSWFDLEMIPGVKNLYLVLGAGGLLAVLLMNRGK